MAASTASVRTLKRLRFRVEGMDCPSCAGKIETAIRRMAGVADVRVTYATQNLSVDAAPGLVGPASIEGAVGALGFKATNTTSGSATRALGADVKADADHSGHAHDHGDDAAGEGPWWRRKARITIVAGVPSPSPTGSLALPTHASWVHRRDRDRRHAHRAAHWRRR